MNDSISGFKYSEIDDHEESSIDEPDDVENSDKLDRVDDSDIFLDDFEGNVPSELCDDKGRMYKDIEGDMLPNNTFVLDEVKYKTDDNGSVYYEDKLKPDLNYELNGNVYTTDKQGRIVRCEGKPELSPENPRDNVAQQEVGGEDRRSKDQGGHIIGRDMNGDGGIGNLIPMEQRINQSDYKRMENDVKKDLAAGKEVSLSAEMEYPEDSERPDKITVTTDADGEITVYKFDNNIDGSLMEDVPEDSRELVSEELKDTDGEISSIKEEYDSDGNLTGRTVNITYYNDSGEYNRTRVYIDTQWEEIL